MGTDILFDIRRDLELSADEETKNSYQRFFREDVKFYGVKTPIVEKIAKRFFNEIKEKNKKEIFSLCEKLLVSNYCEEAFIAFEWAYSLRKSYDENDFPMFEGWVKKYVNNWAKCDTLCNHTLGSYIEQFPRYIESLKAWTKSDNRWLRRASAVTLILPARKGNFLNDVFEICDRLLKDDDDLVQKGYGWLLKEASRIHQKQVFEYIMKNKKDMPRTALRYAIEKLPKDLRDMAMKR
ncbi:DNA alkylation repair protein [Candidatus Bathyarchaeota archaeon]|nr:DNA alkylation repair protein [Candidatus Bathyarchaeota archaeon]